MKKAIPLELLKGMQPLIDASTLLVRQVQNSNMLFHIEDKDERSDFYFHILKQEASGGSLGYYIEYKPATEAKITKTSRWNKLDEVLNSYNQWVKIIDSYNKINSIYDDPQLKINQKRFEEKFNDMDEDASYATFEFEKQIAIDDYLNSTKSKIAALKIGQNEEKKSQLTELENYASEIQENISKETKKEIISRLSRFWAKAQLIGVDVIKEVFVNLSAEIAKKLLMGD